jgi:S1-C subfamily serine protease
MAGASADGISRPVLGIVAQVEDLPEEPEDGDPGAVEGGSGPEEPDAPLRGWIHPDDRLWRHPSELSDPSGTPAVVPPPHHPYRGAVMVLVGVVAIMAVTAFVVVLLSPSSQRPPPDKTSAEDGLGGASLTTLAGTQNTVPTAAQAAGRSMIELVATTPRGNVALVGVAVAEGGVVATMADALVGVQRIEAIGPDGKFEQASVMAIDKASDVALVNVPEDLPVAPFADDTTLDGGSPDLTLSFLPTGGTSVALHCTPGMVTGVGTAIAAGPAGGMPSITSSTAPAAVSAGEPLLDAAGSIVGILYSPSASATTPPTFLPSGIVVGVADDLRSESKVVHGWLGITGGDAPNDGGAKVAEVQSGSPAAGRIGVGQVIVGVNGKPVRSMAELIGRLYVLPPGAPVALTVQQADGTNVVDVTLSASS